jgi:hypothetical protein
VVTPFAGSVTGTPVLFMQDSISAGVAEELASSMRAATPAA